MKRLLLSVLLVLGSALPVAAQNPVSVAQLGTTAIDTNSGNKSNGTQRVVLATDQPTPTNPFNVAQSGNWLVQGLVANDAVYSGNPLPTGCYASASAPADVSADGDIARMWCLRNGALSVNITNATLAATQSGTWSVRTQDGSGNALTSSAAGATRPLDAIIRDTSGNAITTFGVSSAFGSAIPANGTAAGLSDGTNMQMPRVFDADSGAGTQYVQGINLRKIASGGSVEAGTSSDPLRVDPTGTTTQPVAWTATTVLGGYVGRKPTYGSKTTITWTGTSLGNGNGRESTAIDWTSTRCYDGRIRVQTKGQASGTAYLDWYVYTALGDTTYTDLATGTDAAFTAANRLNSRYLGSTKMNANTSAVISEFQLSDIFGSMPDKWGLIGINNSGAALSATAGDHVIEYECVN